MIVVVASVAMNELILSTTTRKPLTMPMTTPTISATMIDGTSPQSFLLCSWATMTAVRVIVAPIDRSNTPAASGTSTAMPSIAVMA